jgi:hypothetical protein
MGFEHTYGGSDEMGMDLERCGETKGYKFVSHELAK